MTLRALLVGLVASASLGLAIPHTDLLVRGNWFGLTSLPVGGLLALLAFGLLVGVPLKALRRPWRPAELALIATMTLAAAGISSFGLTALLVPYLVGPTYFMTDENHFLGFLPHWSLVRDESAAIWFYEGLPDNVGLPWAAWQTPLLAWGIHIAAVYAVFFGLVALLARHWIEREHLEFPLAELPAALVSGPDKTGASGSRGFLREPITWWFCGAAVLVHAFNGLSWYYPSLPHININRISLDPILTEHPWDDLRPMWIQMPLSLVGLCYFLPTRVSASAWSFYLLFKLQELAGATLGAQMPYVQAYPVRGFVGHQMWGGIICAGVGLLWSARANLRNALAATFGARRGEKGDDMLGPRGAVLAVIVGFTVLLLWGRAAGVAVGWTALLFGLYFITHIVATRLACQAGMPIVQHPFRPVNMLLAAFGSAGLPKQQIPMLVLWDHLWMVDNRSPLMPALMLSQQIAGSGGLRKRGLGLALPLAAVCAAVVSIWAYVRLVYVNGGLVLEPWFTTYYCHNLYDTWTEQLVTQGELRNTAALFTTAAGALTYTGLGALYRAFPSWAPHPVGFLMGASYPMLVLWFPCLLAWAVKSVVLWVGGVRLYRRLRSGFLGLVFGEFLCAAFWAMIGAVTRTDPYSMFAF